MIFDFLSPVDHKLYNSEPNDTSKIGDQIIIHKFDETPNLEIVKIAIIGLKYPNENHPTIDVEAFRRNFYNLHVGNWHKEFADLGNLTLSESLEDNIFAIKSIVSELFKKNIVVVLIGADQSLTLALYRSYPQKDLMLNLVNIDAELDINPENQYGIEQGYVSRMITEQPITLNNYTVLGYQTYLNTHQAIDLMDKLYFDIMKLGDLNANIKQAEPYLRDADIVSVDLKVVESNYLGFLHHNPNGLNGKEICALSRYAGISDRVSSFGVFNGFGAASESMLIAQMTWYFIEGVNLRSNEYPITNRNHFTKYIVPVDHQAITFYKSNTTERWWIEIEYDVKNNKLKNTSLFPCSFEDYLKACDQEIPDRWWKAHRRNL